MQLWLRMGIEATIIWKVPQTNMVMWLWYRKEDDKPFFTNLNGTADDTDRAASLEDRWPMPDRLIEVK